MRWFYASILIFACLGGLKAQQITSSGGNQLSRVAVINIQQVLRLSSATKNIKPQLETLRIEMQKKIRSREKSLKIENEALQTQRSLLSPQVYEQRRREFQEKVTALQADARSFRKRLDVLGRSAMERVNESFRKVTSQLAAEWKLQMIIPRATVIYVQPSFDITDEVLKRLDQELPSVTLNLEATDPKKTTQN
jgi:outer membrane protein